jgi:hypothetical protein
VEKLAVEWPGVFQGLTLIRESAVTEREGKLERRFHRNFSNAERSQKISKDIF